MVLQERFELELKKHTDQFASKVAAMLERAEEQGRIIDSLHTSVSPFKCKCFLCPLRLACSLFLWLDILVWVFSIVFAKVAMYKRLYEEEQKLHLSFPHSAEAVPGSPFLLLMWHISIDKWIGVDQVISVWLKGHYIWSIYTTCVSVFLYMNCEYQ